MAGQDQRSGDRTTTSMRIKLKYPDVETFIQKYAINISRGGIFIATKTPKPVGTAIRFEFLLANAESTSLIRGEGQVQWTREFDPAQPTRAHGMGVKFSKLDAESQAVVERALAFRAAAGKRIDADSGAVSSPMPVSESEPTRVAGIDSRPNPMIPDAPTEPSPPPFDATASVPIRLDVTASVPLPVTAPIVTGPGPTLHLAEPPRHVAEPPLHVAASSPTAPMPLSGLASVLREAAGAAANEAPSSGVAIEREDTTQLEPPREVRLDPRETRLRSETTREVLLPPDPPEPYPLQPERVTRPIELPDAPPENEHAYVRRSLDDSVQIALDRHRQRNGRHYGDELDQLATEWGVTPERIDRTLKRKRPKMSDMTAELERLIGKPPRPPSPSRTEAIQLLRALLERRAAALESLHLPSLGEGQLAAQAAGGEPDAPPRAKRADAKR